MSRRIRLHPERRGAGGRPPSGFPSSARCAGRPASGVAWRDHPTRLSARSSTTRSWRHTPRSRPLRWASRCVAPSLSSIASNVDRPPVGFCVLALHTLQRPGVLADQYQVERQVVTERDGHAEAKPLEVGEYHRLADLAFPSRHPHGGNVSSLCDRNATVPGFPLRRAPLGFSPRRVLVGEAEHQQRQEPSTEHPGRGGDHQ